ncbi:methyl-accepting chemotaxis protein, partial [Pseudomonas azotoformans]
MGTAVHGSELSMTVLRNHMEADMMHDALRADVLSAMLVGLGKSTSSKAEVNSSLQEHAEHFRQVLADNLKLPLDDALKASLEKIRPSLDNYIA